jgi:hypothetical protein
MIVGTQTFVEDGTHNYIALSNRDQYLRTFYVPPTGWTDLNIGVLASIETTGTLPQGCGLWIGLATSAQPGVGMKQATFNNFSAIKRMLGLGLGGGIGYLGTYSPQVWLYTSSSADSAGATINSQGGFVFAASGSNSGAASAGNVTACVFPTTQNAARKSTMIACFHKTNGTTYNVNEIWTSTYTGSDGTNHNHQFETLMSAMLQAPSYNSAITIDNVSQASVTSTNLSVQATDDANFPLDTVNLYWTGSVQCRIHALAVSIIR